MKHVMDCGCVVISSGGTKGKPKDTNIIYCPKHSPRETGKTAGEFIRLVEDVDSVMAKLSEDYRFIKEKAQQISALLNKNRGDERIDEQENDN